MKTLFNSPKVRCSSSGSLSASTLACLCVLASSSPAAAAEAAAGAQAGVDSSAPGPGPSGGAIVVGGKVGGLLPFSSLKPFVNGGLELGYAFGAERNFVGLLDVTYTVPQASGTDPDRRVPDEKYSWKLWQKQLVLQPTFVYRLTGLHESLVPYAGIGPRIYLLETVSEGKAGGEDFGTSSERSTKYGVGVPLGAEWALGPGALLGELLFQWAPLDHRITGDSNLWSGTLFLGYRMMF
jgi:hypothetical protein